jgi:ketosteroid isomerase-like protein
MNQDQTRTNEAQIRELVESRANAVRNKDMEAILAHHAPDMLMFDVPPPLQLKGIEAYKAPWSGFFFWLEGDALSS